eukprot:4579021-Amphidinium_carterae.1
MAIVHNPGAHAGACSYCEVYAVDADACAACGNRQRELAARAWQDANLRLIQHAKEGFGSPVYWSIVTGLTSWHALFCLQQWLHSLYSAMC